MRYHPYYPLIIFFMILLTARISFADYKDQEVRTQINEQTTYFKDTLGDTRSFEAKIRPSLDSSLNIIGSEDQATNNLSKITGVSRSEISTKRGELKSIDASNLESAGRQEMLLRNDEVKDIFINESDPLLHQHKKDIKKLAKAHGKLSGNLFGKLKEIGVDCRTVKGDKIQEPNYYLQVEDSQVRDTVFDKHVCEDLRNKYSCKDELLVSCGDVGFIAGSLSNVQGNMHHRIRNDGLLTIGVNRNKYFYNSWGSQQDFNFTFNVSNAAGIETFKLLSISWSDHVLVELNGHKIFGSTGVMDSLNMSTNAVHYRRGRDRERYFGVDRGDGIYVPANTKSYFNVNPNVEARQYLIDGLNTLHIRLVYGKGGKIWTRLQYKEKRCNLWVEEWNERCILK